MATAPKSTREHLIDVGVDLMHRHGYQAAGLAEILKAAGVPKGSFYHHFGSKEEFAAAVLDRYVTREGEHCAAVLGNSKLPALKRLKRYFSDLIRIYGQAGPIPGCMMGHFSVEAAAVSLQLRQQLSASFAHWQQTIAQVIQQGIDAGEFSATIDASSLAGFFLNSWEGALIRSQAEQSDAPLKSFLIYAFKTLLA